MKIKNLEYEILKELKHDSRRRHVVLILSRNNTKYFYKELNYKGGKRRFREQIYFQKKVIQCGINVRLPKLYDYELGEKSWTLWEYLPGPHLADKKPINVRQLDRWLEPIVESLLELEKVKPSTSTYDIVDRLILEVSRWSRALIKKGIWTEDYQSKLVQIIENNRAKIITGFNHSDFVPWHMHEIKFPVFALVDYENCKNKPKYYDLVYFFHRVYINLGQPKLAEGFINIFKQKAQVSKDFENIFKSILVHRVSAGLYEHYYLNDKTNIRFHNNLLGRLLRPSK